MNINPTIWKIKEKIINHNEIKIIDETDNSITIKPDGDNTFPITVIIKDNKYSVYFKGWHENFNTEEEALDVFAFGLSEDCRLRVIVVKDIEYKWILEFKEKNKWIKNSEKNIGMFPLWLKKQEKIYQNHVIKNLDLKK
ncbi:MAG: hypothetical protein U0354_07415 [Candidatus Sericytochromatia bacterium]